MLYNFFRFAAMAYESLRRRGYGIVHSFAMVCGGEWAFQQPRSLRQAARKRSYLADQPPA